MEAAEQAADDTVSFLLSWGASPDKLANNGSTALMDAITSKCISTINLLAPKTQVNLEGALHWLARFKIEPVTGELKKLVVRVAQDRETAIKGLEGVTKFGSSELVHLMALHIEDHSILEENKHEIWREAVNSNNEATVSAILRLLPNPPLEAITLARERGAPGVLRLLLPDIKVGMIFIREHI